MPSICDSAKLAELLANAGPIIQRQILAALPSSFRWIVMVIWEGRLRNPMHRGEFARVLRDHAWKTKQLSFLPWFVKNEIIEAQHLLIAGVSSLDIPVCNLATKLGATAPEPYVVEIADASAAPEIHAFALRNGHISPARLIRFSIRDGCLTSLVHALRNGGVLTREDIEFAMDEGYMELVMEAKRTVKKMALKSTL